MYMYLYIQFSGGVPRSPTGSPPAAVDMNMWGPQNIYISTAAGGRPVGPLGHPTGAVDRYDFSAVETRVAMRSQL